MPIQIRVVDRLIELSDIHNTRIQRWFVVGKKMQAIEGDIQAVLLQMVTHHPGLTAKQVEEAKAITIRLENAKQELAEAMGDYNDDYHGLLMLVNDLVKP